MDDGMIDLMTGDAILRQRLQTYAELRLTPDAATTARIRARVLAVAHRRAELSRADAAALTIVRASSQPAVAAAPSSRARGQRALTALLVAVVAAAALAGTAFAARPGGALYDSRLWAETLTLPSSPSKRALAELERLQQRLAEAREAIRSGDTVGAAAALAAYERIVHDASAYAIASHDEVAWAVLRAGMGHDIEVLQALIAGLPATAAEAITRALGRAIDRSGAAVEDIDHGGDAGGDGGAPHATQPAGVPGVKPTEAPARPTAHPTPTPTPQPQPGDGTGSGQDEGNGTGSGPDGQGSEPTTTHHPDKPDRSPRPTPDPH